MKTCNGPGLDGAVCGRPVHARGWCEPHWKQWRRDTPLRPIGERPDPNLCQFDGCGRRVHARGLCRAHSVQAKKGQDLRPILDGPIGECAFDGCDRSATRNGYCRSHSQQLWRGEQLRPLRERNKNATCIGPAKDGELCGRPVHAKGLCPTHASQMSRLGKLSIIGAKGAPRKAEWCSYVAPDGTPCGRPHNAKGWCKAHGSQMRTRGFLTPIGQRPEREPRAAKPTADRRLCACGKTIKTAHDACWTCREKANPTLKVRNSAGKRVRRRKPRPAPVMAPLAPWDPNALANVDMRPPKTSGGGGGPLSIGPVPPVTDQEAWDAWRAIGNTTNDPIVAGELAAALGLLDQLSERRREVAA